MGIANTGVEGPPLALVMDLTLGKASTFGIKVDKADPTFPWRDIIGNLVQRETGVAIPTYTTYNGSNVKQYSFAVSDALGVDFHIPHDYVLGSDLFLHVHWSHNGTAVSGNIVMDAFTIYAKGHNQAVFTAEKNQTITYDTVNIATTPQYQHMLHEVQLSTSGGSATLLDTDLIEPDGLILMHFVMTTVPTITGGTPNNPYVHFVDVHYQSTNIGTKEKVPDFYV